MEVIKDSYIYKKIIDWSALHQGISIPISLQVVFQQSIGNMLQRGEKKNIKIIVGNEKYSVKLINQLFDGGKYPNHKDILQIRYTPQSQFSKKLRNIFSNSYKYLMKERSKKNGNINLKIPKELEEYFVLYTTEFQDVFFLDSITINEKKEIDFAINNIPEENFEALVNYNIEDKSANIEEKHKLVKIRRLNRSIGNNLKLLYNHRCQICGSNFGKIYNSHIVEAHHIQSFTETKNNNFDNILIICPNHHRIIHKVKPIFDKTNLRFSYKNGLVEKLILNEHISNE